MKRSSTMSKLRTFSSGREALIEKEIVYLIVLDMHVRHSHTINKRDSLTDLQPVYVMAQLRTGSMITEISAPG